MRGVSGLSCAGATCSERKGHSASTTNACARIRVSTSSARLRDGLLNAFQCFRVEPTRAWRELRPQGGQTHPAPRSPHSHGLRARRPFQQDASGHDQEERVAWEAAGVRSDATFVMLAITPAGQVSTFCFTGGRALFVDGAVMLEARGVLDWFGGPGFPSAGVNPGN